MTKLTANHSTVRRIIAERNAALKAATTETERDEIISRYGVMIEDAKAPAETEMNKRTPINIRGRCHAGDAFPLLPEAPAPVESFGYGPSDSESPTIVGFDTLLGAEIRAEAFATRTLADRLRSIPAGEMPEPYGPVRFYRQADTLGPWVLVAETTYELRLTTNRYPVGRCSIAEPPRASVRDLPYRTGAGDHRTVGETDLEG